MNCTHPTPLFLSIALVLAIGGTAGQYIVGGALLLLLLERLRAH